MPEDSDSEVPLEAVLQIIERLLAREAESAPQPRVSPESVQIQGALAPPTAGKPLSEVMRLLEQVVEDTPRSADPRFLNQLFGGRMPIATAAEVLASYMNVSMYTYKAAGPNVLLEWELLSRMRELCGFPEGDGCFLPGGSLANLIGMLLGRNAIVPESRETGLGGKTIAVYCSGERHYSVNKAAGILGLGRENVRSIPFDENGSMLPEALAAAMEEDRAAGVIPGIVVATSGTTVRGAFDPIDRIAEVSQRFGAWLHVDAAVGGSLLLHRERYTQLAGIERADSVTWDAHKMMGVPLTCSALLVRDPDALTASLDESADYLFQNDDDHLNPGRRSLQCGRRNDALKLWAAWQHLGDEGWHDRIDRQLVLADEFANLVEAHDGAVLCERPPLTMINFVVPGKSSAAICARLHQRGDAVVGYGDCAGVEAIRLVTMNPDLELSQLKALLDTVVEVAAELPEDPQAYENQRTLLSRSASAS